MKKNQKVPFTTYLYIDLLKSRFAVLPTRRATSIAQAPTVTDNLKSVNVTPMNMPRL